MCSIKDIRDGSGHGGRRRMAKRGEVRRRQKGTSLVFRGISVSLPFRVLLSFLLAFLCSSPRRNASRPANQRRARVADQTLERGKSSPIWAKPETSAQAQCAQVLRAAHLSREILAEVIHDQQGTSSSKVSPIKCSS